MVAEPIDFQGPSDPRDLYKLELATLQKNIEQLIKSWDQSLTHYAVANPLQAEEYRLQIEEQEKKIDELKKKHSLLYDEFIALDRKLSAGVPDQSETSLEEVGTRLQELKEDFGTRLQELSSDERIDFYRHLLKDIEKTIKQLIKLREQSQSQYIPTGNPLQAEEYWLQIQEQEQKLAQFEQRYTLLYAELTALERKPRVELPDQAETSMEALGAQLQELQRAVGAQFQELSSQDLSSDKIRGYPYYIYNHHHHPVVAVAWSPQGDLIASVSNKGTIRVWDATTWDTGTKESSRIPFAHRSTTQTLAWSPDGKQIVSAKVNVLFWEVRRSASGIHLEKQGLAWSQPPPGVEALAWASDNRRVAVANKQTIKIWDVEQEDAGEDRREPVCTYAEHTEWVHAIAWSWKTGDLASAGGNAVHIWVPTGARGENKDVYIADKPDPITALAWSPDGQRLVLASGLFGHGWVEVWDARSGENLFDYKDLNAEITSVAWSPDGQRLAIGSRDHTVQVRDVAENYEVFTCYGSDEVTSVAWSPDGKYIASASLDHTVQVWQAE